MVNITTPAQEKQKENIQKGSVSTGNQALTQSFDPKTVRDITSEKVEEFRYQTRPRINLKKLSKNFTALIFLLIVLLPLAFIFLRYNPFDKKVDSQKSGEVFGGVWEKTRWWPEK
jgi:hypothetical protein